MSERIRVLVVDDDALVRAGLSMLLAGADDIGIVGEATPSGRRTWPATRSPPPVEDAAHRAGDQDAAAVMAELPRQVHLVYRWILRPRYVAQQRWQPVSPATNRPPHQGVARGR